MANDPRLLQNNQMRPAVFPSMGPVDDQDIERMKAHLHVYLWTKSIRDGTITEVPRTFFDELFGGGGMHRGLSIDIYMRRTDTLSGYFTEFSLLHSVWKDMLREFYLSQARFPYPLGYELRTTIRARHLQNETPPAHPNPFFHAKTATAMSMVEQFWKIVLDSLPSLQHPHGEDAHYDDYDRYGRFVKVLSLCNSILRDMEIHIFPIYLRTDVDLVEDFMVDYVRSTKVHDAAFARYIGLEAVTCAPIHRFEQFISFEFEFSCSSSVAECRESFAAAYHFLSRKIKACKEKQDSALSILHDEHEFLIVLDVFGEKIGQEVMVLSQRILASDADQFSDGSLDHRSFPSSGSGPRHIPISFHIGTAKVQPGDEALNMLRCAAVAANIRLSESAAGGSVSGLVSVAPTPALSCALYARLGGLDDEVRAALFKIFECSADWQFKRIEQELLAPIICSHHPFAPAGHKPARVIPCTRAIVNTFGGTYFGEFRYSEASVRLVHRCATACRVPDFGKCPRCVKNPREC